MAEHDLVWLRVRGRDRDRQLRKKLGMSLRHLTTMNLVQFQKFLAAQLELERPLAVAYCDDEGDRIPVTCDDELNVLVYMAEMAARQGAALELRLREPRAANDGSLISARQLARRAEQKMAARAAEIQRKAERRAELQREQRRAEQVREAERLRARVMEARAARAAAAEAEAGAATATQAAAAPDPTDQLWARVEAWQQSCVGGGGGGGGGEDGEDGWRARPPPPEVAEHQPGRSQPLLRDTTCRTRDKRRDVPTWFATFMKQFQRDVVTEVVAAVKAELAAVPAVGSACLCPSQSAATGSTSDPKDCTCVSSESASAADEVQTQPQTTQQPTPAPAPAITQAPAPAMTAAPAITQAQAPGVVPIPAPAAEVVLADAAVQTPPPVSSWPGSLSWPSEPAAAPVDKFGLFSVSETALESATGARGPAAAAASSDTAGGRTVPAVFTGKTVYSAGGRSVETTGSGRSVETTGSGRPPLRSACSMPLGRPRPRPRRCRTEGDDTDYSCMLVMVEHSAADAADGDDAADDVLAGSGQAQPSLAVADGAPLEPTAAAAGGAVGGDAQTASAPPLEPPVSVAEWVASEPPPPALVAVDAPEPETAANKPAAEAEAPAPQSKAETKTEAETPVLQPKAETELEAEEGYVTVNGRRLSLSEDDFSDIVIISSPEGSERFEMVEEEAEEEGSVVEAAGRREAGAERTGGARQVTPDAAGEALISSALSDRWVDAAASLDGSTNMTSSGSGSGSGSSMFCSQLMRSTCESAPAACPVTISSPAAGAPDRTVSLPTAATAASLQQQPAAERAVETPAAAAAPKEQEMPAAGEQTAAEQVQESTRQQSGASLTLMDPLKALPAVVRRRLLDSLQRLPEARQRQLASDLTGRRCAERFWERLCDASSVSGRSQVEELLLDQAERPGGVGLLADSLDGMLRHIKVSATSSAELDGLGAQAVKHALCLLRVALGRAETAVGTVAGPEQSEQEAAPRQQEQEREVPGDEREEAESRQEREEAPRQERREGAVPRQGREEQQASQQEAAPDQDQEAPPRYENHSAGHSGLTGLLPGWVQSLLGQQDCGCSQGAVSTEAEALMIMRLAEMGFSDISRMRALYRQHGDDCNMIASYLLDGEE